MPELFGILTAGLFLGIQFKIGGFLVRPFDFAFVVLLIYAGMTLPRTVLFRSVDRAVFVWLLALLMLIEAVNALFLVSVSLFVKESLQNIEQLIFLFALSRLCVTPEARSRYLKALLLGVSVIAVGTVAYYVSVGELSKFKDLGPPKYTFGIMTTLLVVHLLVGGRRHRLLLVALVMAALVLTLASGERKGWISLVISVAIVASLTLMIARGGVISSRLVLGFAGLVPVVGTMLLLLQVSQSTYIVDQIESIVSLPNLPTNEEYIIYSEEIKVSNRARYFMTLKAIDYMKNSPVYGIGTDRLKELLGYEYYFLPGSFIVGAHNEYLRYGSENGVPSLIIYIMMWVLLIFRAARIYVYSAERMSLNSALTLSLAVYGAISNLFMGGDAVNTMLAMVPMALVVGTSTHLKGNASRRRTAINPAPVRSGSVP